MLGVTLAPEKKEGPTKKLVFLGIEIDTVTGRMALPADKLTIDAYGVGCLDRQTCLQKTGARVFCRCPPERRKGHPAWTDVCPSDG